MSALWHQYWKAENNLPPCCLGFVSTADAKIIIFPWVHAADVHAALSAVTRVLGNLKPVLDFTSSLSIIQYGSAVQLQHERATGDYAKIQMRRCIASPLNPAGQPTDFATFLFQVIMFLLFRFLLFSASSSERTPLCWIRHMHYIKLCFSILRLFTLTLEWPPRSSSLSSSHQHQPRPSPG